MAVPLLLEEVSDTAHRTTNCPIEVSYSTDEEDEVARILRDNGVTYTHDHTVSGIFVPLSANKLSDLV